MKKIAMIFLLLATLAVPTVALAAGNGWSTKQNVTQVFVIDTDLGPVCQFSLSNNSMWAFKVASREKVVELLQAALLNAKLVQVNYYQVGQAPDRFLTFTPLEGSTQTVPLAYGVNLNR